MVTGVESVSHWLNLNVCRKGSDSTGLSCEIVSVFRYHGGRGPVLSWWTVTFFRQPRQSQVTEKVSVCPGSKADTPLSSWLLSHDPLVPSILRYTAASVPA
ncbi:hypothetical protein NP493_376g02023 [Ridgeia piscesae]|uniref:Uncharacterized protein n=1 Tax=Ridgeia piscesae TaxID=27915 RepID=A0AAD9L2M3_RIDPI|nr:hypothetical protein NP493_376g02023 [Ridgeia piscesae]